jgi:hypothetical protein
MNGQNMEGEDYWSDGADGEESPLKNKDKKKETVIMTYRSKKSKEESDDEPLDLIKLAETYSNIPANLRSFSTGEQNIMPSEFNTPESRRADLNQKKQGLNIVEFKKKVLKARQKEEDK